MFGGAGRHARVVMAIFQADPDVDAVHQAVHERPLHGVHNEGSQPHGRGSFWMAWTLAQSPNVFQQAEGRLTAKPGPSPRPDPGLGLGPTRHGTAIRHAALLWWGASLEYGPFHSRSRARVRLFAGA